MTQAPDGFAVEIGERARAIVRSLAPSPEIRLLLDGALAELDAMIEQRPDGNTLSLPRHVTAAVTGRDEPDDLAAILALIDTGARLLDDVHDGDANPALTGLAPLQIHFAALALLGPLPQLALCRLDVPAPTIAALHAAMGRGLLGTGAGQYLDVMRIGAPAGGAADAERAAAGKAGARRAMFAEMAALHAGAAGPAVAAYAELGHAIGTASQIRSDAADLCDPAGRDLRAGIRSYPVAATLERLGDADRADVLALLDAARTDPAAAASARERLLAAGALRRSLALVQLHAVSARRALDRTGAHPAGRAGLERLIDG